VAERKWLDALKEHSYLDPFDRGTRADECEAIEAFLIESRFLQLDRILYFRAVLLWLEQGFCDTMLCIRHKRPFVVTVVVGMYDNAFAAKSLTRRHGSTGCKTK
jgi:hypothetical protein